MTHSLLPQHSEGLCFVPMQLKQFLLWEHQPAIYHKICCLALTSFMNWFFLVNTCTEVSILFFVWKIFCFLKPCFSRLSMFFLFFLSLFSYRVNKMRKAPLLLIIIKLYQIRFHTRQFVQSQSHIPINFFNLLMLSKACTLKTNFSEASCIRFALEFIITDREFYWQNMSGSNFTSFPKIWS